MIEVLAAGPQTSIQDGGRPGYIATGLAPAGAQDWYSFGLVSLLVGNILPPPPFSLDPPGDAGLEVLVAGPTLRFEQETVIAIGGARFEPELDGELVPLWESVAVPAGSTLDFGKAVEGARGYLATAGGIDVPSILGSRATCLVASRGGHEGRALRAGDRLSIGSTSRPLSSLSGHRLREEVIPSMAPPWTLRAVAGPQDELYTGEALEKFFTASWKLSPVANRMGFRFQGPVLEFKERADYLVRDAGADPSNIVDDVIPVGGIQTPGGQEAIVMGIEAPSVGGYAKIGTVITADMSRLGQIRPGEEVRFVTVSVEEAVATRRWLSRAISKGSLEPVGGSPSDA